ncbi:MAG TPA: 2-C-methyl-D-erythritol 2,4-cyclodiphosphate synthase [Tissierellales bacterium]|nr:2-C-methyl-D-erythritol 2,4-cyclodiphosphate synthase [Tissierellales bacterium]
MRIGIGYDVHKMVEGRKLIIGGVDIPHEKGLLGHSDADVLVHAIMDSILGALALNDIGKHFPDTDMKYKDISSMVLLEKVYIIMEKKGYEIGNIDSVIAAQSPKLAPYILDMRKNIGKVLNTPIENINVKATTTEELGFVGKKEGISSYSVCLLKRIEE